MHEAMRWAYASGGLPMPIDLSPQQLAALAIATSFAAGLNVYATIATLGLLAQYQVVDLPPALRVISDWWVIGGAGALFCVEFVADKVPFLDLIWNALQTFVRVPVAAFVAYGATSQLSPPVQLLAAMLGATIAFAAHGGKTAARVAVTPSPEPFSNIALSFGEDVLAVSLTWFATQYPYIAAAIAIVLVVVIVLLVRVIVRALKTLVGRARATPA
jgi:hypothetical protein